MKRPRAHVIEDESVAVFKSLLPKEWIVRGIQKDYGVDYEVEIVEGDIVTGSRLWFQLKGTISAKVKKHQYTVPTNLKTAFKGRERLELGYLPFKVNTKLLKYSLACDFPLQLGVVDVAEKEVYWLPLRDEVEQKLELRNPKWRKQKAVTVRIPMGNSLSKEKSSNYFGLRWYALEPARMRAFSILHSYYHEVQYRCRLSGYNIGERYIDHREVMELIQSLRTARSYLKLALGVDCLFGERGLDIFVVVTKPQMEEGLEACEQLLQNIPKGRVSFPSTAILVAKVQQAVNLMSTCISMYQDFRKRFLYNEQPLLFFRLK